MTWTEVVSDAVKIGLGALIGGVVSLIAVGLTHRHRKAEEYTTRRRDSLEAVMPEFDGLSRGIMAESVRVMKAFPKLTDDAVAIDTTRYNYAEREAAVRERNLELNVVEAKVALLGLEDIAKSIDSFRSQALAISQIEKSSGVAIVRMIRKLRALKDKIIIDFAEAYRTA